VAFQCASGEDCQTFDANAGANACFILEPEWMENRLSRVPGDSPELENEVRVVRWIERDDGLTPEQVEGYLRDDLYGLGEDSEEDDDLADGPIYPGTKLGSAPCWIQSSSEAPEGGRFLGQLDCLHAFLSAPKNPPKWVRPNKRRRNGSSVRPDTATHLGDGPNFGDMGRAYLFVVPDGAILKGVFFWQCC
jgi:hypothetical protein